MTYICDYWWCPKCQKIVKDRDVETVGGVPTHTECKHFVYDVEQLLRQYVPKNILNEGVKSND